MKDKKKANSISDGEQDPLKPIPVELWNRLERKLLGFGGSSVRWQKADPQAALIDVKGHIFTQPVRMKLGEPHRCHSNATDLCTESKDRVIRFPAGCSTRRRNGIAYACS
jgi:hypothetical protein